MKAIVHIGTEKTGTSSIQLFLLKNRKKLLDYGYHFLQSAGKTNNWALPAFCSKESRFDDFYRLQSIKTEQQLEEFKQKFLSEFEGELRTVAKNVHTIVISSEHFHSRLRSDEEIGNVQQLLSKYFDEIKIICYIREQAETCTSWYSTSMKSGGTDSFYDFVQRCRPESYYFNYFNLLSGWERYFGVVALDVALFDQAQFLNGNLLDDFTARLDPALVGRLNNAVRAENESLNPAGQALVRAVNMAFPISSDEPGIGEVRDRLKKIVASHLSGRGQRLGLVTRKKIYDSFIDSNEQLRQKFFPTLERLFSSPIEEERSDNVIDQRIFEVLTDIFSVLKENGENATTADEYERLWSAVSTSICDAIRVKDGVGGVGTQVFLTEDDGRILRSAALRIEGLDVEAADLLMRLAREANPRLPGMKKRLELYSQKKGQAPKFDYMITYHSGDRDLSQEVGQQLHARYDEWVAGLDVPVGAPVTPVGKSSTTISGGKVIHGTDPIFMAYTLYRAETLEEAISIAEGCPLLEIGSELVVSEILKTKIH